MRPYLDLHCDTLMAAWSQEARDLLELPRAMLDLRRLQQAGCGLQCFAIFMPREPDRVLHGRLYSEEEYYESLRTIYENTCATGEIRPVRTAEDLLARQEGQVCTLLTVEGAGLVHGRMERLEQLFADGVRLVTLTWNDPNCFGSCNSRDPAVMAAGLTDFGREAVGRMQEMGMIVDVSHLSDGGFWDVAELAKKPFVASHSNCRALNPHPRSMTDEMIRTLADHGGVMGVNWAPQFLRQDLKNPDSTVEDLVRHVRHMVRVGGLECAAVGTDLDGTRGNLELGSADKVPLLFRALEQAGFTEDEVEKIAWGNGRRVLLETLPTK